LNVGEKFRKGEVNLDRGKGKAAIPERSESESVKKGGAGSRRYDGKEN